MLMLYTLSDLGISNADKPACNIFDNQIEGEIPLYAECANQGKQYQSY